MSFPLPKTVRGRVIAGLSGLAALISTFFLQPIVGRYLDNIGVTSAASATVGKAISSVVLFSQSSTFPWLAGITIGLVSGSALTAMAVILIRADRPAHLSKYAKSILNTATHENAPIKLRRGSAGPVIEIGSQGLGDLGDIHEKRLWKAGMAELVKAGRIEDVNGRGEAFQLPV